MLRITNDAAAAALITFEIRASWLESRLAHLSELQKRVVDATIGPSWSRHPSDNDALTSDHPARALRTFVEVLIEAFAETQ